MLVAEAKRQRKALWREIEREERKRQRAELAQLRADVKAARAARREAIREARRACGIGKREARTRARELRRRLLEELKSRVRAELEGAKSACENAKLAAREGRDRHARARGKLAAERAFRASMRIIKRNELARRRELAPRRMAAMHRTESDDEVRAGIPPELVRLFERVKSRIKGGPHHSRTEAFLHYAEEHPSEVLESYEDETDRLVRELEERERKLGAEIRAAIPRTRRAELERQASEVPF